MTAVGVIYLLLNFIVGRLARWLEIATRIPR
jgi:ABC-type amino acid transport system permease subunit